ncbi:hypothetical protein [Streptomyces sp. LUP30]|uniref:hypothetical protein n=1 Tax=Streptomyces sp. LUP30 TaxID=1890285 RepID=UPI00114C9BD7|nr:hypothetical protein [Streptomyces sp. LUP30]
MPEPAVIQRRVRHEPPVVGEGEDRLDPLNDLIPAVIRKLPGFELADPAQVPMVTGVLMAAAMGMDTVAWRDQFGTIPPGRTVRRHRPAHAGDLQLHGCRRRLTGPASQNALPTLPCRP